jgi:hypothetical protein
MCAEYRCATGDIKEGDAELRVLMIELLSAVSDTGWQEGTAYGQHS